MGKASAIKVHYMTRNRIYYMRRNATAGQFAVFIAFFSFLTVPKTVLKFALKKQFKHLKSFIKGVTWNMTTSKYSPE